jgi:hypothetical protein
MVRKRTLQERRRSLGCRPRTGVLRASVFGVLKMVLLVFAMLAQEGMNASPVEQDDCRLYPGASIAVPATGRGACVQQIGPPLLFVHYTRQSLLLVQVEESMASALYDNPDLRLVDDGVALLYCPTALLDPLTGTPTSECLFSPEVPGPSALTGTGQIQANVAVDLGGSVGCPSSIHIRGLVNTREEKRLRCEVPCFAFRIRRPEDLVKPSRSTSQSAIWVLLRRSPHERSHRSTVPTGTRHRPPRCRSSTRCRWNCWTKSSI